MTRRTKATLTSRWWKNFYQMIRFCFSCGQKLTRRHIPTEGMRRHICIACSTITYLNPKIVAGLIPVDARGRVALLRRNIEPGYGRWTYPAGYMELGETIEEAALRETFEEIGARAKVSKLLGMYSYRDAGVLTIVYIGRLQRNEKPVAGIESLEVKMFEPTEIPWKDLAFRSTTQALQDWLRQQKK